MSSPLTTRNVHPSPVVLEAIGGEWAPLPIDPERAALLRRRVVERVRRSAKAHRDLATVRREDEAWAAVAPGVLRRTLRVDDAMHVELLKLGAHVRAPWPRDARAQEILVVEGGLAVERRGKVPMRLAPLGHCVIARAAGLGLRAGSAGATLYVRRRATELETLSPKEACWWAAVQSLPIAAAGPIDRWTGVCDGADALALHVEGDVASMLVRVAAGAVLPDHDHGLDEDCFMLEGDLFLGDILMRAGDYQRAHAGGRHVDVVSEAGGLFYFHGVLPAAASGDRP